LLTSGVVAVWEMSIEHVVQYVLNLAPPRAVAVHGFSLCGARMHTW
jgi:hypothetical protein